ncbi:P-loop NTPase family protein [Qipengyuania sp. CAU 1752]
MRKASVPVAVYKNTRHLPEGLAGRLDIDLLARTQDMSALQSMLLDAGAIRAFPHPLYDNALAGREDWYLLDANETVLHLDIADSVKVGPKFCKAYRIADIDPSKSHPRAIAGHGDMPILPAGEEARLALARLAFRNPGSLFQKEVECREAIIASLDPFSRTAALSWRLGDQHIVCRIRRSEEGIFVYRRSLAAIRRAIRAANETSRFGALRHIMQHAGRRIRFGLWRRATRLAGGSNATKRRLRTGAVIALIGPDGVGKSTQSREIAKFLGRRFRCASIYLGSNDGGWMRVRQRLPFFRKQVVSDESSGANQADRRSWLHAHLSALWRLLIACNRFIAQRRSLRLAARGVIVIADRWPQDLEAGILDGPSVAPSARMPIARLIWSAERRIYASMAAQNPSLAIHLDCDFETSHQRKPGDIAPAAFASRIALMERMRRADPQVVTVDARQAQDQVFADLLEVSWNHLAAINR